MKFFTRLSYRKKQAIYSTISNGLDALIFVLMIAIGRLLGDEIFGKFSYIQSVAIVFLSLGSFGLNAVVVRDLSKNPDQINAYIDAVFPLTLLLSLVALLMMALFLFLDGDELELVVVGLVMGVTTMFRFLTMTVRSFFHSLGRFDLEGRNVVLENAFLIPASFCALLLGYGLLGIAIALCISRLFGMIVQFRTLARHLGRPVCTFNQNYQFAFKLQMNAIPIGLGVVIAMLINNGDTIILTRIFDFSDVGMYNASLKIYIGLMIIPTIANSVLAHHIASVDSYDAAIREYWRGSFALFLLATALLLVCGPFAAELITIVYGEVYRDAGALFVWHLAACVPAFQVALLRTLFISIGKMQAFLVMNILTLVLRITLLVTIVPTYGLISAAKVVFFTELATSIAGISYVLYFCRPALHRTPVASVSGG